jgi:FKBP-type peptidyl-prolyl cis-trans isomerase FkpA
MRIILLTLLAFIAGPSCRQPEPEHKRRENTPTQSQVREGLVDANRQLARREDDLLDAYVKSHKMPFIKVPSGIRYYIYKHSASGDSVRTGMTIAMDYEVSLLDGTHCYSSREDGVKTFEVGHENLESGIQMGVQFLKKGDKALILIPSPLAHGLLGDFRKIPPQMPIVYDVYIHP